MGEDVHFPYYERDVDEAAERAYRATQGLPRAPVSAAVPLETARATAERLVKVLAPACDRIEIGGSIRRSVGLVKDIELIAIPRGLRGNLLGEPMIDERNDLDVMIAGLMEDGHLEPREPRRMGRRYQALRATKSGIPIDLFVVMPPAQWGAIFTIRTGSRDFSRLVVTQAKKRGRRVSEGRLLDEHGKPMETPTERDFLAGCGVHWVPPEERL